MKQFDQYGINMQKEKTDRLIVYEVAGVYSLIEKKVAKYLKKFGLSPSKFNVLMIIRHQGKDEGLSQIEISKRILATPSNMTRLLDRMKKKNLITRFSLEGDRRVNLIRITSEGSALLDKLWPEYCEIVSQVGSILNKKEQTEISKLLLKWFNGIL